MRIAIVGGGPAGLYFAILAKRLDAANDVRVYERNAADDTFGFGVVFSDETLEAVAAAEPETYAEIAPHFARWAEIDVHYRGEVVTSGGHGFSALSRRTLLDVLQRRAAALGVQLHFDTAVDPRDLGDADLIVGADGVNSVVRSRHEARVPAVAGPAPREVHVARHRPRLRRLQVLHRRDRARRVPGPRLSVRQHDEHLHRGDLGGDLAAGGARPYGRPRAGRERRRGHRLLPRSSSPTCSTATA